MQRVLCGFVKVKAAHMEHVKIKLRYRHIVFLNSLLAKKRNPEWSRFVYQKINVSD